MNRDVPRDSSAPVVRVALPPADLGHPAVAQSLERGLEAWLSERRQSFYRQFSDNQ